MLERPDLEDAKIAACLKEEYRLDVVRVTFLPLGADANAAVYQAVTAEETSYFVKLRRGAFDETSVIVPKFLRERGIEQIIAPVETQTRQLRASLDDFNVILYPYVEGRNGYDADLSECQWVELGAALKGIHTTAVPPELGKRLQRETYLPQWREQAKGFQARAETETFEDPISAKLAAFLKAKRADIDHLVRQAERLGAVLQTRPLEFVLCHADIHPANILIGNGFYIVDWDSPILAPKERDLMFIGGGFGRDAEWQSAHFYQGYGETEIDPVALGYYRYERIVQDIAAYCEQILLSDEGSQDREEGLRQLTSQFLPSDVVEIACRSESILPPELKAP